MTNVCPAHSYSVFWHQSLPVTSRLGPVFILVYSDGLFPSFFLPSPCAPPASTLLSCLPAHLFCHHWPIFDTLSFFLFLLCLTPRLRLVLCSHLIQVCPGNLILSTALNISSVHPNSRKTVNSNQIRNNMQVAVVTLIIYHKRQTPRTLETPTMQRY